MSIHQLLFPTLKDKSWGYVNFGEESRIYKSDPEISPHWVQRVHESRSIEFSYGGYMEDRSFLMRGQYQKPGETWHLGIDYTVPAGTPVHLPCDGRLHIAMIDQDQNGGWGGKLIFRTSNCYLIIGHLDKIVSEIRAYKAGEKIAEIADFSNNGGWFPHLHIQTVPLVHYLGNLGMVDGYSKLYDGIDRDFPRPDLMIRELAAGKI